MARLTQNQYALKAIEETFERNSERTDAGEVAFVAKDLEFVFAQTYDVEYPELKALSYIPVDTSVPAGATEYSYGEWNFVGKARFINDYANDFQMVDASLRRLVFPIAGIGIGYQYTVQDLRAAAMRRLSQGMPLDQARAKAARLAHEQFVDDVACFGDVPRQLKGFVNHSDVPTVTPAFGSWDTLDGSDASNGKIAQDITKIVKAPEIATLGLYVADTLLLPLSMITRLFYPTSTFVREPLLQNVMRGLPQITTVEFWNRLDAAYSNLPGSLTNAKAYVANEALMMAYKKSSDVVKYVIPLPFTQHPPQQKNLAFVIPCESRTGGVCMIRPLACARMNVHS